MKNHPLAKHRVTKIRAGAKIWTPRAGGAIETSDGSKYVVDDNGSTLIRHRSETEETERQIEVELRRLAARLKVFVYKSGEDEFVDVAKIHGLEAAEVWSALRELPSNCGYKKVIETCNRLKRRN